MSALFVLIGCSLLIAGSFLAAFIWSIKNGQYDDDYTPSVRILLEDENKDKNNNNSNTKVKLQQHAN
jgi:cbb3-type cytochrome oxidase maturation protein